MNGWLSILAASAVGSLHCVGMCGGLVSFYAASDAGAARLLPHAAYHAARLVAYVGLGAAAGGLGAALDWAGARAGLGDLGLFVVALALLLWAVPRLGSRPAGGAPPVALGRRRARRSWLGQRVESLFGALASRLRGLPPVGRAGALGLASALLPCGWLYAFVVLAAGSGSAGAGAVLMLAFWLGTVPALLGVGVGVARLSGPLRARLPRLSAALVLAACAVNVAQRWPLASATDAAGAPLESRCHAPH